VELRNNKKVLHIYSQTRIENNLSQ